jgi:hypothetical protein
MGNYQLRGVAVYMCPAVGYIPSATADILFIKCPKYFHKHFMYVYWPRSRLTHLYGFNFLPYDKFQCCKLTVTQVVWNLTPLIIQNLHYFAVEGPPLDTDLSHMICPKYFAISVSPVKEQSSSIRHGIIVGLNIPPVCTEAQRSWPCSGMPTAGFSVQGKHFLRTDTLCVRFEVFTAVTMKNGVFRDVTPCGSWKNRRFGRT